MKVWSQKNLEDILHEYIDFDGEWYLAFGRPETVSYTHLETLVPIA